MSDYYDRERLHEIWSSGQPLRTREIIAMLQEYGYGEPHSSGSSHVVVEHSVTGKIFTLPNKSTDLRYQRMAIKDCLEILEARNKLNGTDPNVELPKVFSSHAHCGHAAIDTLHNLPHGLTGEAYAGDSSFIVLRSQTCPAIGIVAPAQATELTLEVDADIIREQERKFLEELSVLEKQYGCRIENKEDGDIRIAHSGIEYSLLISPYDPDEELLFDALESFKKHIRSGMDTIQLIYDEEIMPLAQYQVPGKTSEQDNIINWSLRYAPIGVDKVGDVHFETDLEGQKSFSTIFGMLDQMRVLDFGQPGSIGFTKGKLKKWLGAEL